MCLEVNRRRRGDFGDDQGVKGWSGRRASEGWCGEGYFCSGQDRRRGWLVHRKALSYDRPLGGFVLDFGCVLLERWNSAAVRPDDVVH